MSLEAPVVHVRVSCVGSRADLPPSPRDRGTACLSNCEFFVHDLCRLVGDESPGGGSRLLTLAAMSGSAREGFWREHLLVRCPSVSGTLDSESEFHST